MNIKHLASRALLAIRMSITTRAQINAVSAISAAAAATAATAIGGGGSATTSLISSYGASSNSRDTLQSFQLGNYSYELARVCQYDLRHECYGHQARHAASVMDSVERECGPIAHLSYPAQRPAGMLDSNVRLGSSMEMGGNG